MMACCDTGAAGGTEKTKHYRTHPIDAFFTTVSPVCRLLGYVNAERKLTNFFELIDVKLTIVVAGECQQTNVHRSIFGLFAIIVIDWRLCADACSILCADRVCT